VRPFTPLADPPVRPDGRCVQCRKRRKLQAPKTLSQRAAHELLTDLAQDAFCSARCARAWHGCSVKGEEPLKAHDAPPVFRTPDWEGAPA
jgi:hypothetical protein